MWCHFADYQCLPIMRDGWYNSSASLQEDLLFTQVVFYFWDRTLWVYISCSYNFHHLDMLHWVLLLANFNIWNASKIQILFLSSYKSLVSKFSNAHFVAWTHLAVLGRSFIILNWIQNLPTYRIHFRPILLSWNSIFELSGYEGQALIYISYEHQARYFMDEVKDKSNKQIDTISWKQEMVDDLPLQQNGYACFLHVCLPCSFSLMNFGSDFFTFSHWKLI